MAWSVETSGLWRSIQPSEFLPELQAGVYRSTDNDDSWTLASTGLTSTEIAGLGINNIGHIFAATRSIMGEGGGMFRSTDNGDSWTEQNHGLLHSTLARLRLTQSVRFSQPLPAAFSRRLMTVLSWSDISSGLIPVDGVLRQRPIHFRGGSLQG